MPNQPSNIVVRIETPDNHDRIREVTIDAFAQSDFGHNGEADLVDALRASEQCLSLVACRDAEVVGHILFSPAFIRTHDSELAGMALAPMSVATEYQRQGIGSLLINTGLERLSIQGCPYVIVLGHPEYYSRFGFQLAAEIGVAHGFNGITQEVFFIRSLGDGTLKPKNDGRAYYDSAFGPQHEPP